MKADIGIRFIIAIFIWLVSWTAAIDIPHEDLSNPNKICASMSSCKGVDPKSQAAAAFVADNYGLASRRSCLCDDRCAAYGDCCTDSAYFEPLEQQRAAVRYSCVKTAGGDGAYVTAKCPAAWRDRDACETPDPADQIGMLGNPVTSRTTGRSYRNRFCAICNGDAADAIVWDTRLVCENLDEVPEASERAVLDTLRYVGDDGNGGQWTVEYRDKAYGCESTVVPPAEHGTRRSCLPGVVVTCHPKWQEPQIRSDCEAYTTVMYNGDTPYKNAQCAMCNLVPLQNLTCEKPDDSVHIRFPTANARSFTALFVARPDRSKCNGTDSFYDPFGKTCRPLVSVAGPVPPNCSVTVAYPTVTADRQPSVEYVTLDNGTTAACANAAIADPSPASEALRSTVITYVGLSVSVMFLIVHLAVFAALPEMKNLSSKNLASFCVSLLCSYTAFVAGNWLTGPACYADALLTYYSFLTSFAWMLIMSFDCWRSLRLATVELRVTTGRQTKKFLVYSVVCWLVPAMMTFVAFAADTVSAVPDDFRPRFGREYCWFGSKTGLLLFFAGPLAAVMAVNVTLFVWTAYMIHSSRATIRHVNTRHVRRDFRMYCRLAVLMGITWVTGVMASYVENPYLWVLFVVLNTFQGLFVFVAFTCRRRILDSLVGGGGGGGVICGGGRNGHRDTTTDPEKDNNNKNQHRPSPPSFSWTSSDNMMPNISSEKTSDTLY